MNDWLAEDDEAEREKAEREEAEREAEASRRGASILTSSPSSRPGGTKAAMTRPDLVAS